MDLKIGDRVRLKNKSYYGLDEGVIVPWPDDSPRTTEMSFVLVEIGGRKLMVHRGDMVEKIEEE